MTNEMQNLLALSTNYPTFKYCNNKIIEINYLIIKYIKITLVHQAGYSAFPHLPAAPELIAAKVWPSISPSLFVFPLMYKGPPSSPLHGPYKNQIKSKI